MNIMELQDHQEKVDVVSINKFLNTFPRKDLEFKRNTSGHESESCWIEILNNKTPNTLIGVFYRHPSNKKLRRKAKKLLFVVILTSICYSITKMNMLTPF